MISKLNLVNLKTKLKPNYPLNFKETYIKFYLTLTGEIIIEGVIDNNYIYWFSITKLNDLKTNEDIFNYVARGEYEYITDEYTVLKEMGLNYDVVDYWYKGIIGRSSKKSTWCIPVWETPFGHFYELKNTKNHGNYFANDVCKFYDKLIYKCKVREGDGAYKEMLIKILDRLDKIDFMNYDNLVKPIDEMLKDENYLILSANKEIRDLYIKCRQKCIRKYNDYMNAVR